MTSSKSDEFTRRALRILPGGVSSPARAFGAVGTSPLVPSRAIGAKLVDIEGREYIDFVQGWGSIILGHANPSVTEAIDRASRSATSIGLTAEAEVELAENIRAAIPSVDMVRFVTSGTEATMLAVRLARASTGRKVIVKFAGGYHGHVDELLQQAGSAAALADGLAKNRSASTTPHVLVLPYNDESALDDVFERIGEALAAVIIEPVAANMGLVPAAPRFLRRLRELCNTHGSVLVFDEVVTGFRLGSSGAQGVYDVRPDLTCLGKVIGGGLPLAAVAGPARLLEQLAPMGPVFHAGTGAGNPVAAAAGVATLKQLDSGVYSYISDVVRMMVSGLNDQFHNLSEPACAVAFGTLCGIHYTLEPPSNFAEAQSSDRRGFSEFYGGMLSAGVFLAPSPFEAMYVGASHDMSHVEYTIASVRKSVLARRVSAPSRPSTKEAQ